MTDNQITVPFPSSLAPHTTQHLQPDRSSYGETVAVDLSRVTFIRPFGLVFLNDYIQGLLDDGAGLVRVHPPSSWDVQNYMIRMRLTGRFEREPRVDLGAFGERVVIERDLRSDLVELQEIVLANDDDVHESTERLMAVILENRPDLIGRSEEIALAVSELLSNVEAHSRAPRAAIAVQRYAERIEIAISDRGKGIPAVLGGDAPDAAIICNALKPHVSTRVGFGGMGLPTIVEEIVDRCGGRLVLRSGRGQVYVGEGRSAPSQYNGCHPAPGTLIEVRLPC